MREGRTGVRLKNKHDKTVYTIQVTGEQIMLIRSLHLRIEQTWIHIGVAELLRESGKVERVPFWECYYCQRGSYENAASIPHSDDCIIPLADAEFGKMNEQFIHVESKKVSEQ